ncbi:MAG: hypothetical protein MUC96_02230 [Myxococcaceae bacterium]|jgi:hypothetical protein|nr:hypothetical protein [Myxococcaceae bacterium]
MSFERVASLVLWSSLLAVAFLASPPASPDTNAVIVQMMTGRLEGVNLSLFALFNLMGVFPMAFLALLAFDATAQKVPKWPFVLGSFALGAFVLLPYLVLRRWNLPRRQADTWWLRGLASRWLAVALVVAALALVGLFVTQDVGGFLELFRTQQFPFVMSFDFVACCLAAALLAREEARVRGQPALAWWGLLPAVGLPLVLALRKR